MGDGRTFMFGDETIVVDNISGVSSRSKTTWALYTGLALLIPAVIFWFAALEAAGFLVGAIITTGLAILCLKFGEQHYVLFEMNSGQQKRWVGGKREVQQLLEQVRERLERPPPPFKLHLQSVTWPVCTARGF